MSCFILSSINWFKLIYKYTYTYISTITHKQRVDMMKFNLLCLLGFAATLFHSIQQVKGVVPAVMVTVLKLVFKNQISSAKEKVAEKINKNLGRDVSIGDLTKMDVEMVKVVEPIDNIDMVCDYLNSKASHNLVFLRPYKTFPQILISRNKAEIQSNFNEVIGIFVILNESESTGAEVLMSVQPCLLTHKDHYFRRQQDPCRRLTAEIMNRIVDRFDEINSLRIKFGDLIRVPAEWDSHWRQIIARLDDHDEVLDMAKRLRWLVIKDQVSNKRML